MDYVQAAIDFDKAPSKEVSFQYAKEIKTHDRENNNESEQALYSNRKHFNDKCQQLYDLLMSGQILTVYSALVEHKIASLPRRALDLKQAGVLLTGSPLVGTRIKEWKMTQEQIKTNREKFKV